jgi:hypothetical protein
LSSSALGLLDLSTALAFNIAMKTLIITLAALTFSFATGFAKDSRLFSTVIPDGGDGVTLSLSGRQWLKITNFVQNNTAGVQAEPAGIAVFKGDAGLWVLFATNPNEHAPHDDVFVAGPATVVVTPPKNGATVFLSYQRGSE